MKIMQEEEKSVINDRLNRIKNFVLLNIDFSPHTGIEEGRFGMDYFLFKYAVLFDDRHIFDIASELFDELLEGVSIHEPITFRRGLAGYGYGILSLVGDDIVEIDNNLLLKEIDKQIYAKIPSIRDLSNSDGLLGIGRYLALAALNSDNPKNYTRTLLKISNIIDYTNFSREDTKFLVEFISYLIKLDLDVDLHLKTLTLIIQNSDPLMLMPSDLLELFDKFNIIELKDASLDMYMKIKDNHSRKNRLQFDSVTALRHYLSACYLDCFFPSSNSDFEEMHSFWFSNLFNRKDKGLIAGLDISKSTQNFRVFNRYANFGLELIKLSDIGFYK